MGKALYRQFRPSSFDQVIGQDHITTTLKNSLANNAISHAYLLTGPRGVGKTSIARILAYEVNNLPYDDSQTHLDIIEIDAASNRRIDEIRNLREKVHIAPTSGKYKVYIIDEVHMLTREAFNALLKTLEEPPEHAIFILATTEIHKLPDTIVSRCITFTFRPIDQASVIDHLTHIASSEGLKISQEAISLLAKHGEGSFRDSISLLDQVKSSDNEITLDDVELALGIASKEQITKIISSVKRGETANLTDELDNAYIHGANETNLAKQIAEKLRISLISKELIFDAESTLELLSDLLDVSGSSKPRVKLEISLLKQLIKNSNEMTVPQKNEPKKTVAAVISPAPTITQQAPTQPLILEEVNPEPINNIATTLAVDDDNLWNETLTRLKEHNNILYSLASGATANFDGKNLTIELSNSFSQKQFSQSKNKAILLNLLSDLGYKEINIVTNIKTDSASSKTNEGADPISSISNIFGGSEVLES